MSDLAGTLSVHCSTAAFVLRPFPCSPPVLCCSHALPDPGSCSSQLWLDFRPWSHSAGLAGATWASVLAGEDTGPACLATTHAPSSPSLMEQALLLHEKPDPAHLTKGSSGEPSLLWRLNRMNSNLILYKAIEPASCALILIFFFFCG